MPADGQGLIRFAHPFGAPSLRYGVGVTAFLSNEGFEPNPASPPIKKGCSPREVWVPADGQGLIRYAHPFGAPSLRYGVGVTAFLSNEGFEPNPASPPIKKGCSNEHPFFIGGEAGIRTLGGLLTLNGFQDRRIQPLCHLS